MGRELSSIVPSRRIARGMLEAGKETGIFALSDDEKGENDNQIRGHHKKKPASLSKSCRGSHAGFLGTVFFWTDFARRDGVKATLAPIFPGKHVKLQSVELQVPSRIIQSRDKACLAAGK